MKTNKFKIGDVVYATDSNKHYKVIAFLHFSGRLNVLDITGIECSIDPERCLSVDQFKADEFNYALDKAKEEEGEEPYESGTETVVYDKLIDIKRQSADTCREDLSKNDGGIDEMFAAMQDWSDLDAALDLLISKR